MADIENSPRRNAKRKSDLLSPSLPRKVRRVLNDSSDEVFSSSLDESATSSLSSKAFYGSSQKKKYLTPLERKHINSIRGEESDLGSSFNAATPSPKPRISLKSIRNGQSPKPSPKTSLKPSPKPSSIASLKPSPKTSLKLLTKKNTSSDGKPVTKTPELETSKTDSNAVNGYSEKDNAAAETHVVTPKKESNKKFFRNRSPGKRLKENNKAVANAKSKGMNFKYKPSGVGKKERSPKKKLMTPKDKKTKPMKSSDIVLSTPQKTTARGGSKNTPSKPETPTRASQRLLIATPTKTPIKTPIKNEQNVKLLTPTRARLVSSKTSTPRRTPRKTPSKQSQIETLNDTDGTLDQSQDLFSNHEEEEEIDSGMGKPTQDFELRMFESPLKSSPMKNSIQGTITSTPDSVMLISDIGSTPNSSAKSAKKWFPIFGGRNSPCVRASPGVGSKASSSASTPGSTKYQGSNRLRKATEGKEQMMLDFGQKRIGATQCEGCGMTYSVAEPEDEATHHKFHQRLLNVLKFPGWKKERVAQQFPDGSRIVLVLPDDKFATKKLDQIKRIVDEDLGFVVEGQVMKNIKFQTFLYISDNKVVGCCMAQVINQAYRVLSQSEAALSQDSGRSNAGRPWCCSTHPEYVRVGISRIWVLASHRRHNIATKLLDCVRYNFIMGCPLTTSDIAFSDPTPAGMGFASHYTGTPTFLVYKSRT